MKKEIKGKNMKKLIIVLTAIIYTIAIIFVGYKISDEIKIRGLRDKFETLISGGIEGAYNAKSLVMVDLNYDDDFVLKNAQQRQLPASLAKLYVIDYASTIANLYDIVEPSIEAISMTKKDSSVANIKTSKYYLKDLFAAMLVPSGNDAAYVVADYCGGKLSPKANSAKERINIFIQSLNEYMKRQGYSDTVINDPSGYDTSAYTTVLDLKAVSKNLMKFEWFKDTVSQATYTATLLDGTKQTWKSTNQFLDLNSDCYNNNVLGIKTGSLEDDYNLIVLYKQHGREFLICSLGSQSNSLRYEDVSCILQTIDDSNYLKNRNR